MLTTRQYARLRSAAAACALALSAGAACAETVDGQLEHGDDNSVLWTVSPGSGDLIGMVFANASQAGQVILAHCQPDQYCVVEGAILSEPEESLVERLHFSEQPSGWWAIEHAGGARIPQAEAPPPPLASPPANAAEPAVAQVAQPSPLSRITQWWDAWRAALKHWLLALFGR